MVRVAGCPKKRQVAPFVTRFQIDKLTNEIFLVTNDELEHQPTERRTFSKRQKMPISQKILMMLFSRPQLDVFCMLRRHHRHRLRRLRYQP